MEWYVVKVHNGREQAVEDALRRRVRLEALDDCVGRVVSPVERVAAMRNGRRTELTRKLFPGYLLCELSLDDCVLALVREIPGVGDFVGNGSTLVPVGPVEVERWLAGSAGTRVHVLLPAFARSDQVRVLRGAFSGMEDSDPPRTPESPQKRPWWQFWK